MKKLFAGLLVFSLITALYCGIATAEDHFCGDGVTWTLDDYYGSLTISGTGPMYDYSVPGQSPPWRWDADEIYTIHISDGVTHIGSYAFWWCNNLSLIDIPASVTSIGQSALANCLSLEEVEYDGSRADWEAINIVETGNELLLAADLLCNNTDSQVSYSFDAASGRLTISGTGSMPQYQLYFERELQTDAPWYEYRDSIRSIVIEDGVTSISGGAFVGCTQLTDISIADSVVEIGVYAFFECSSLPSIRIPDGVRSVREEAFCGCTRLADVTLPANLAIIDFAAFYHCTSLTRLVFPAKLAVIRNQAFDGCSSLTGIAFPHGLKFIGTAAFASCHLTDITVTGGDPSSLHFFYPEDEVYTVNLPSTVSEVGEGAFIDNPFLPHETPDFSLPEDLTVIEDEAFLGIDASFVWISDNVGSIGSRAFANCSNLKYVYIPNGCSSIGADAFPEGVTILCGTYFESTYAETYAQENGFSYLLWEDPYSGNG